MDGTGSGPRHRNLRAAGEGELRLGRRIQRFAPVEIADADPCLGIAACREA